MDILPHSFRFAWRMLRKQPAATALAIVALGLGIGLTTTMFGAVYGILLRGLPFEDGTRILHLERIDRGDNRRGAEVPMHDFVDWQEMQQSFEGLSAFTIGTMNLSDEGYPDRFEGAFISHDFLRVVRTRPILGRGFTADEGRPGGESVVLLGYDVWRTRYDQDPGIVGKTVRVNGEPSTVVGVMGEGFKFPIRQDVWLPLRFDVDELPRGEGVELEVFGRLRDGVSLAAARAEMSAIAGRLGVEYPQTNADVDVVVKPFTHEFVPDEIQDLFLTMLGAVCFVLLIACANVASLLLARSTSRGRELATRLALGADRRRIVSHLLAESLMLAAAGSAVGLALAHWGGGYLRRMVMQHPEPPYWAAPGLEPPVLLFVAGVTIVAGIVAGLWPALQASRTDVATLLKSESRTSSNATIGRFAGGLVIGEIALASVLLIGAGLMTRSIVNLQTTDLKFDPENLLTARLGLSASNYPEPPDRLRFFEDLIDALAASPAVASVAATSSLPTTGDDETFYRVEGKVYQQPRDVSRTNLAVVTPGFFDTFEVAISSGRAFTAQDREDALPVVIVNRNFAALAWPGEDPLGQRLRLGRLGDDEPWRTVIGVVPDVWMNDFDDLDQDGIYVPLAQLDRRFLSIGIKTHSEPLAATAVLRGHVLELDRDIPLYQVRSMDQVLEEQRFFFHFFAGFFTSFGLAALLMAAVGIYGTMAFAIGRRIHEFGVRIALGARPVEVLAMVLRQGAVRLGIGLALGLGAALVVSRLLVYFLFDIQPDDPTTFAVTMLFLAIVALLACFFPAQRAMRVDPVEVLRQD